MRLNLQTSETIRGGAKPIESHTHKTTINNTIFRIVTQGLYIRPIEAIVREICTNALDGHLKAGKGDVPFKVLLPTTLNPYFIVRDYGCSMDRDTMFNIYGVLGESTKNLSSNEIGGWGVGGKSPAAYTDTFFITTYLNGKRSIYQSSCLSDRSPLELMLEGDSDEPTGVEVKIPVKEQDFHRFWSAAKTQLAAFDVKPIIPNAGADFEYAFKLDNPVPVHTKLTIPNSNGVLEPQQVTINSYAGIGRAEMSVRMGCVVYPINRTAENYNELDKAMTRITKFSGVENILFDLPVDAVDIKPSREDLDYTDRTIAVINDLVLNVDKYYKKVVTKFAWEARKLPVPKAIEYLDTNCHKNMANYIKRKYKRKPVFPHDGLIAYAEMSSFFTRWLNSELRSVDAKHGTDWCTLRVSDGQTAKKISSLDRTPFRFRPDGKMTIFRREPSYIRRIEYLEDTDGLPANGLFQFIGSYYTWSERKEIEGKHFKESSFFLAMTQEELDIYRDTFKLAYPNLEVVTLPKIPKHKKTQYTSQTARSPTSLHNRYFFSDENEPSRYDYQYVGYSFKGLAEIKAKLPVDTVHVVAEKDSYYSKNLLIELCKFFQKDVTVTSLPSSFFKRVVESEKVTYQTVQEYIDLLLSRIKPRDIALMQDYFKATYTESKLKHNLNINEYLVQKMLRARCLREYFFKFLPAYPEKGVKYKYICEHFSKEVDTDYLDRLIKEYRKRINYRIGLFVKQKPTLNLVNYASETQHVIELFKLNFKGFNNA